MVAAPALDQHKPWLNYEALAGTLAPAHVEAFDWNQALRAAQLAADRARDLRRAGRAAPDYWKAEDLDLFNGTAGSQGDVPSAQDAAGTVSATPASVHADDPGHDPRDARPT